MCILRICGLYIHFIVFTRLRAYIGFLPVRHTLPNSTHEALAALQHAGAVGPLITQNVDGLHHAALRRILPEPEVDRRILELHGNIFVSRRFCFPLPLPSSSAAHNNPSLKFSVFLLVLRNFGSIQNLIIIQNRKCIVNMDTSTHAQRFKNGLAMRIRAGAGSLPSWSEQAHNPRQIPTAMLCWPPSPTELHTHYIHPLF